MNKNRLPEALIEKLEVFQNEQHLIPEDRKSALEKLSHYISEKLKSGKTVRLIVICTHNSRRSHIGQLWLNVAAIYLGLKYIETYSGGTEATAFNHRSVAALRKAGFPLIRKTEDPNPVYAFDINQETSSPTELFSKKYDSAPNPTSAFAAIMVCSEADEGCPFIPGAESRFSLPYQDPKNFDDTPQETAAYDERVLQIGREMCYVLEEVKEMGDL